MFFLPLDYCRTMSYTAHSYINTNINQEVQTMSICTEMKEFNKTVYYMDTVTNVVGSLDEWLTAEDDSINWNFQEAIDLGLLVQVFNFNGKWEVM